MQTSYQTTAFHKPLFLYDTSVTVALSSLAGAYNRAYLATVLRTFAQIPRSARNFRYARPLDEMDKNEVK
jgi:hypothetical protein